MLLKIKKYIITAITITTRRFGPSRSSRNQNIVLDTKTDVIPRISNEIFFDLKYIFLSIYQKYVDK